jgi:hypothetical protein
VVHLADLESIKTAEIALSSIEEAKSDDILPRERKLLVDTRDVFQG